MPLTLTRRPDEQVHFWASDVYIGSITTRPGRGRDETKLVIDMPQHIRILRGELVSGDPSQPRPPAAEAASEWETRSMLDFLPTEANP